MWQWRKLHFNLNEHPFAQIVEDAIRVRINLGSNVKNNVALSQGGLITALV